MQLTDCDACADYRQEDYVFLKLLVEHIVTVRYLGMQIIIAGDFNCHDYRLTHTDNKKGKMLRQIMEDLERTGVINTFTIRRGQGLNLTTST